MVSGGDASVIAKLDSPRTLAAIPLTDSDAVVGPVAAPSARRVPAVEKSAEIFGVVAVTEIAFSRLDESPAICARVLVCGNCRATVAMNKAVELGHSNRVITFPLVSRMHPLGTC